MLIYVESKRYDYIQVHPTYYTTQTGLGANKMFQVITGRHPITGEIVNVWYTSVTGDRYRVIGVSGKWMICNEDNRSKWITKEMYDTLQDAMRYNP
jgi:hypothetical protein